MEVPLKTVSLYVIRTEFLYTVQNFVIAISVIRDKMRATSVQCEITKEFKELN